MTIDTAEFAALTGRLDALAERVEQTATAEAILAAAAPSAARTGPRHARPRRDRHGLRLIPGGAR